MRLGFNEAEKRWSVGWLSLPFLIILVPGAANPGAEVTASMADHPISDPSGSKEGHLHADTRWIGKDNRLMTSLQLAVNFHACVAIADRDGTILQVKDRFCEKSGYRADELVGSNHRIVNSGYHPPEFFRQLWATILDGRVWQGEIRNRAKDGSYYWVDTVIVPQLSEGGVPERFVSIRTDISRLKAVEADLRELTRELDQRVEQRTAELQTSRAEVDALNRELEARVTRRTRQFRLMFEHAPLGVSWVEFGKGDEVYHLNDRFCRIIGLSKAEAQDFENIQRVSHPDDLVRQKELQRRVRRGEIDRFSLEKRYLRPDGRTVWADLTVAVMRDQEGRIAQQFAIINDITSRKRAEEQLAASERRFRAFVENASEILYALSLDGHFQYVSPSWEVKLGHPIDSVIGRSYMDFVHPDDLGECRQALEDARRKGRLSQSVEYRILHKDGTYRWHASTGSFVRDESGKVLYFFGVGRDVTARRQAEAELRKALERREELERIIEKSPSVVILWRATEGWPVEFVSDNIRIFGYAPEELLSGRITYTSLMHDEDREEVTRQVHQFARRGIRDYSQHYRLVTRKGDVRWVDDRTIIRVDESGRITHHQGIITDVTERKTAELREDERREADLRMAGEIQQHMLPARIPHEDEIEVESLYVPSSLLGGDYFDLFPIGDRRIGLVVADVSGKGASAALIMAACRTVLRMQAERTDDPVDVLVQVNRIIQADMPENMFISIIYGVMDLDTGGVRLAVAGHEPAIVWHGGGREPELIPSSTLALGLDGGGLFGQTLVEHRLVLGAEDMLILYTDGITEALDERDEEFGRDGFLEAIRSATAGALSAIMGSVRDGLDAHCGSRDSSDDRTLLLLRRRMRGG